MWLELKKVRFPVETGLLLAFCVFLPLQEFWKSATLLAYLLVWLANRLRTGSIGSHWGWWDALVVAWIGSAYLAAAFAGLDGGAWAKTGDVATHALLLWLVMRAGYTVREHCWVLGALVASAVIGLLYGYWRIWSGTGKSGNLQLYSVGQVNHTAIYLAMILGVCVSWLFSRWREWRAGVQAAAITVTLFVFASLVVTASRGAIGVGILLVLLLALLWWPRWRAPLIASVVALAVAVLLSIGFGAGVVKKQMWYEENENVLASRDGVWRMALAAWEKYPWFGVGKDNYGLITHDLVRSWRAEAGKDYDASRYIRFPHAHNLYVNTLAERGIVGFAGLAALLLGWLAALLRHRPRAEAEDSAWLLWGSAASAWIVTTGVGLVNTTFHHEHGLLAVLLLGLWLSTLPARTARRAS